MILWIQTHGFFKDQLAIQSKILINKWQEIKENYFWQIRGFSEIQAHTSSRLSKTKAYNKPFKPKWKYSRAVNALFSRSIVFRSWSQYQMLVKGLKQDVSTSLITGKKLNEAAGLKVSWPSKQVYFAVRTMILSSTINVLPPYWTLKLTELGRVKNDSEGKAYGLK